MAGSEASRPQSRDLIALVNTTRGSACDEAAVHERLTNSVKNDREKQSSSFDVRVASMAVVRTAGGWSAAAYARVLRTEMDEQGSNPSADVDESAAWLDFLEECRQILSLTEESDPAREAALTPALFETARRLHTRTARVLARVMITRLAERLAIAPSSARAAAAGLTREPLSVTNADSLLQSSAPSVVDPRVRTVLQYVESRHNISACRLDDVARNLHVSRSYLSRLVFKETGVTFNRHLQLARMNTAARLLQESELSIKEISSARATSMSRASTASSAATSIAPRAISAAPSAFRERRPRSLPSDRGVTGVAAAHGERLPHELPGPFRRCAVGVHPAADPSSPALFTSCASSAAALPASSCSSSTQRPAIAWASGPAGSVSTTCSTSVSSCRQRRRSSLRSGVRGGAGAAARIGASSSPGGRSSCGPPPQSGWRPAGSATSPLASAGSLLNRSGRPVEQRLSPLEHGALLWRARASPGPPDRRSAAICRRDTDGLRRPDERGPADPNGSRCGGRRDCEPA